MAGTVNKVIIVGRLGKDPEVRSTQSGGKIVNMSVATSETWKDRASGERKEQTEWHRVVCFDEKIADVIERFVKKGSTVYIEGTLKTRKYTNNQGAEVYTTEVVIPKFNGVLTMLDGKGGGDAPADRAPAGRPGGYPPEPGGASQGGGELDDTIPFSACWQ